MRDIPETSGYELCSTSRRVLIVERDAESVRALRGNLTSAGFQVTALTRGEDALEVMTRENPHLVMLDWEMPGVVTMNLIRRIQHAAPTKRIRLMALSQDASEQQVVTGFELGNVDNGTSNRRRIIIQYKETSPPQK